MGENEFASSEVVSAINDYLESAGAILELTGTIYYVFDATVAEAFSPRLRSWLPPNAHGSLLDQVRRSSCRQR